MVNQIRRGPPIRSHPVRRHPPARGHPVRRGPPMRRPPMGAPLTGTNSPYVHPQNTNSSKKHLDLRILAAIAFIAIIILAFILIKIQGPGFSKGDFEPQQSDTSFQYSIFSQPNHNQTQTIFENKGDKVIIDYKKDGTTVITNNTESCENECETILETICIGDYVQVCGNYDSGDCLTWGQKEICTHGCEENSCKPAPNCQGDCEPPRIQLRTTSRGIYEGQPIIITAIVKDNGEIKNVKWEWARNSLRWYPIETMTQGVWNNQDKAYHYTLTWDPHAIPELDHIELVRIRATAVDGAGNEAQSQANFHKETKPQYEPNGACAPAGFAPGQGSYKGNSCCEGLELIDNPLYGQKLSYKDGSSLLYKQTCQLICTKQPRSTSGSCPVANDFTKFPIKSLQGNPDEVVLPYKWEDVVQGQGFATDPLSEISIYRKAMADGVIEYSLQGLETFMYWRSLGNINRPAEVKVWFDSWNDYVAKWLYENEGTAKNIHSWEFEIPDINAYCKQFFNEPCYDVRNVFYIESEQTSFKIKIKNQGLAHGVGNGIDDFENCTLNVAPPKTNNFTEHSESYSQTFELDIVEDSFESTITLSSGQPEGWYGFKITCQVKQTGQTETGLAKFPIRKPTYIKPACLTGSVPAEYGSGVIPYGIYDSDRGVFAEPTFTGYKTGIVFTADKYAIIPGETNKRLTSLESSGYGTQKVNYEDIIKGMDVVSGFPNSGLNGKPINPWGSDVGVYIPGLRFDGAGKYYDSFNVIVIDIGTSFERNFWMWRPITQQEVQAMKEKDAYQCLLNAKYPFHNIGCWDPENPPEYYYSTIWDRIDGYHRGHLGLDPDNHPKIEGTTYGSTTHAVLRDGYRLLDCN